MSAPRVLCVPARVSSRGVEAVELCASAGLVLDAHQQLVLDGALGVREDGSWAAFEVGIQEPRQNGKGAILEARELAGLFLFGERLIIHSAHQVDTSLEHFRRLLTLIEDTPELVQRVLKVRNTNGQEEIQLRGGQRIRFRTRSKGGGRGFSGDCVIFDEAMFFPEFALGAILPVVSARPNPQVWYAGSAVDQLVHEDGVVWARIRERGIKGDDPRLAYFDWSVDAASPSALDDAQTADEALWAAANPALGARISVEHVANERRSMDPRTFAVERLGVGDWPSVDGARSVIDLELWETLRDPGSSANDPVVFGFDVSPDRSYATIAAAGERPDGLHHIEVVDRRRGTGWLVARIVELVAAHHPEAVVCDAAGAAGSLLPELERAGVAVLTVTTREHANACGLFFDTVEQEGLRHLGTAELNAAVRSGRKRPIGDAWLWSRKHSDGDISPLVACTLALWRAGQGVGSVYEERPLLSFSLQPV